MPALYIVSTPIGNLGDFTYRAVEALRRADVILAEDTRRTAVLLKHYGIEGRLISANEHNESSRSGLVAEILREGRDVALVSDAGTPLLSDPGARIVASTLAAGFEVVPIPGASALLAALVASGLPADRFTFYGFIPKKGGDRSRLLGEIASSPYTCVLYESPHRVGGLVGDLLGACGPARRVVVAREITKLHEEFYRGTLGEAEPIFAERELKGEVVVVVEPNPSPPTFEDRIPAAQDLANELLSAGLLPSAVAKELRSRLDIPRNVAYDIAHGQ